MISSLSAAQQQRLDQLVALIGAPRWVKGLFERGCVLAGGAAVFVGDDTQCLRNVGDIDFYAPLSSDDFAAVMAELEAENLLMHVCLSGGVLTIYLQNISVQLVRMPPGLLLSFVHDFDFDYLECAISAMPAPAFPGLPSLMMYMTQACAMAWRTRSTRQNPERGVFSQERLDKMTRKGFNTHVACPSARIPPHTCSEACVARRVVPACTCRYTDGLAELETFGTTSYIESGITVSPLSAQQQRRWHMLVSTTGLQDTWWQQVFYSGACVAGGAALFVGDTYQCLGNLGDIDVWCPFSGEKICSLMRQAIEELPAPAEFCVTVSGSSATMWLEKGRIQFIRLADNTCVTSLLMSFDYTYVQCALVVQQAPAPAPWQLCMYQTRLCQQSWTTRQTAIDNRRVWMPRPGADVFQRQVARNAKLQRKGFTTTNNQVTLVLCQCTDSSGGCTRTSEHRIPRVGTTNNVEATDKILAMPTFQQAGYATL